MNLVRTIWTTFLSFSFVKNFYVSQGATYEKIFIIKNFSTRLYKKNYIFDYLFILKFIINFIMLISLTTAELFEDFSRYAFKSGIFKQSYFSLYIRFKKRNSSWYHLLYAQL